MSIYFANIVVSLLCGLSDTSNKYYGEPVVLRGRHIYFTSWKYVRQGNFRWNVRYDPNVTEEEKQQLGWLKGDGIGAQFQPVDMPYGIRLVAQKAEKVSLKPGQMIAQIFDEGKYKASCSSGGFPRCYGGHYNIHESIA